jgi:hypothetical protein
MKIGRLFIVAIAAIVAVAAAATAIIYFRDEILELFADLRKQLDHKKSMIFNNNEYTDYADI